MVDWFRIGRLQDHEKHLEILILRQQLGIAERKLQKPVRVSRVERLTLAVLTTKLRSSANCTIEQLRQSIRIFQPKTVLDWHRQLVKRKWTYNSTGRGGRPRIGRELERLVVRLAQENDDFGYDRIQGELEKLGYTISDEGIANILRRHNIPPSPERGGSPSWRHLMTPPQQARQYSFGPLGVSREDHYRQWRKRPLCEQAPLRSVLAEYVYYYNNCRPHQRIRQQTPIVKLPVNGDGSVQKRPVLGGILNDYYRMAA